MKMLLILCIGFACTSAFGQTKNANSEIEKTILSYATSGDNQNVSGLKAVLHDQYRLVWYGGKDAPFIADKPTFLMQFETKEWGGDSRKVRVESIELFDGINATAKVTMDGNVAEMRSLLSLIKVDDSWQIIGELVNATFK